VIKHPMDFDTMKAKLRACSYKSIQEFTKDVTLICENCKIYNLESSVVYKVWDWESIQYVQCNNSCVINLST
jgi:hypothetical protein